MRRRFATGFLLLASVLWLLISAGCTAASTASEPATVPARTEETSAQNTSGQIYLYGESHSNEMQLKKELEIWQGYYATGMRHLFVEMASYSAEYLNLWMQAEDDTILEELYEDWEGTQGHSQYTMDFYRAIKETCPETIFHGTDVGHQYKTTGNRYLVWLNYKGMKDSDTYRQTLDSIEQGKTYYRDNDAVYRENQMVKNFAQAFDSLEGESVMGIYGAYHVSLEGDEQTSRMAAQLRPCAHRRCKRTVRRRPRPGGNHGRRKDLHGILLGRAGYFGIFQKVGFPEILAPGRRCGRFCQLPYGRRCSAL